MERRSRRGGSSEDGRRNVSGTNDAGTEDTDIGAELGQPVDLVEPSEPSNASGRPGRSIEQDQPRTLRSGQELLEHLEGEQMEDEFVEQVIQSYACFKPLLRKQAAGNMVVYVCGWRTCPVKMRLVRSRPNEGWVAECLSYRVGSRAGMPQLPGR